MASLTRPRAIADYLSDRQRLIVVLMKLTSAAGDRYQDSAETLRIRLCEQLIDYLSTGYFRVYGDLLSARSWRSPRAYASFEATTTAALRFNDGFATPGPVAHMRLKPALAELALALETRFELEDELFAPFLGGTGGFPRRPHAVAARRSTTEIAPNAQVAYAPS